MTLERSIEAVPDPEKMARWNAVRERVEQMKDKLGKGVDRGIEEAVVAFLANEIATRGSCEGHLEERLGEMRKIAPYIEVGVDVPVERFVDKANDEETDEYQAARIKNNSLEQETEELMAEFYRGRASDKTPSLGISRVGPGGYFFVRGINDHVDGIDKANVERYGADLLEEQEDMRSFTEFLKKRFFSGQSS